MQHNKTNQLKTALSQRILILDGAMGTMIQKYKLMEADFRGERFKDSRIDLRGNNDLLTLTQPLLIFAIHEKYLESQADIIETNIARLPLLRRITTYNLLPMNLILQGRSWHVWRWINTARLKSHVS